MLNETSVGRAAEIMRRLHPAVGAHDAIRSTFPLKGTFRTLDLFNTVGATAALGQIKRFDQFKIGRTVEALRLGSAFDALRRASSVMPRLGILAEAERLAKITTLDSLEIDSALQAWATFDAVVEHRETNSPGDEIGESFRLPQLSWSDWLGIFSILLTVLIYFKQEKGADEAEARQIAEVRKVGQEVAELARDVRARDEDMARIAALLEELSASRPVGGTSQYVARDRVSIVREARASGKTVALVYPNQLADCVLSDGKWMKIRFRDWVNNKVINGWVMKKHWVRVPIDSSNALECAESTEHRIARTRER
ncbi:hypothetical protein [Lysobacter enzymogenes]|uniref:hypothetical protein n=1 Tax=Lysobacter enzymogenes TaxID=69 RepID=UPI000F4C15EC|nr:hypothetical protein [Lysobacter enzymogenes]